MIIFFLIALVVFCCVGCGGDNKEKPVSDPIIEGEVQNPEGEQTVPETGNEPLATEYTVSFDVGVYANSIESIVVKYGDTLSLRIPVLKSEYTEEYEFVCWTLDGETEYVVPRTYNETKDITLIAKYRKMWTKNY